MSEATTHINAVKAIQSAKCRLTRLERQGKLIRPPVRSIVTINHPSVSKAIVIEGTSGPAPSELQSAAQAAVSGQPNVTRHDDNDHHSLKGLPEHYRDKLIRRFVGKTRLDATTGCLVWIGSCHRNGYGRISIGGRNGRIASAHRVAWELAHGPVDADLVVRHKCHNRRCVNPRHLQTGTTQDNMRDMTEAGRGHSKLTDREAVMVLGLALIGWSPRAIAEEFGASKCLIRCILNGTRRENAVDAELAREAWERDRTDNPQT